VLSRLPRKIVLAKLLQVLAVPFGPATSRHVLQIELRRYGNDRCDKTARDSFVRDLSSIGSGCNEASIDDTS